MSVDSKMVHRFYEISRKGQFAMLLDISTPKPGNVHRYQDHSDTRFIHFVASITQLGCPLYSAARWGYQQSCTDETPSKLGELLKTSVQASMAPHGKNTLLGTILLLVPLAVAAGSEAAKSHCTPKSLHESLATILHQTSVDDAIELTRALKIASPGGAIPNTPEWTPRSQT
ncbi:MAG: triphosphoribosyl-dephospho-CoA synthase, partial [Candidatus Thorarchaeota archaeon]